MPASRYAARLMGALSSAVGERVVLDANGECALAFAGGVDLVVAEYPEEGSFTVRASLLAASELATADLMRTALAFNYARLPRGHSVAVDPQGGALSLVAQTPPNQATPDEFLDLLAGFLELVPKLRSELAQPAAAPCAQPSAFGLLRV